MTNFKNGWLKYTNQRWKHLIGILSIVLVGISTLISPLLYQINLSFISGKLLFILFFFGGAATSFLFYFIFIRCPQCHCSPSIKLMKEVGFFKLDKALGSLDKCPCCGFNPDTKMTNQKLKIIALGLEKNYMGPTDNKNLDEYLTKYKDVLLKRKIRKFTEKTWFEWGGLRNKTHIEKYMNKPCIYMRNITRKEPAFIGKVGYFNGSLIMLVPKSDFDLAHAVDFFNSQEFKKVGQGIGVFKRMGRIGRKKSTTVGS